MKRNPIHKTIQALALLLFVFATVASAANVTLQTADDGTKYVYIPNEDTDYLNISASDIDNGLRTFKIYATNGHWENYKKTRTLEISLPEGSFIGANAGNSKLYRCHMRINGSNTWSTVANKNSLKVHLYTGGNKDASISQFEMTAYIEVPRSISLNSVSVGGSATFFNKNAEKRWSKNRMLEGDLITVTAIPEEGYFLKGIEIKKENDILNDVSVGDVDWYSNPTKNIAQFVMPDADISVKPIFVKNPTAEDGFYINMDGYTKSATIPDGIKSFKVHYGGGMSLRITAPSGKSLMVTGTMQTGRYLLISDGESWSTSLKRVSLGGQGAGTATDIGTFVSLDNHVSFEFGTYEFGTDNDRLDLTVELLSGSTSLGESEALDYKEVSRTDPLTLYANMKYEDKFLYTLEYRHSEGAGWSGWDALRKDNGFEQDIDYVFDQSDVVNGFYAHSFEIPYQYLKAPYEYMEFRYKMIPLDENNQLVTSETSYTSTVKVRLMNKVTVKTDISNTNTNVGKYSLTMNDGAITLDTNYLIPYGTEIQVQANVPAGYEFKCWNPANDNFCKTHTENPITLTVVSDTMLKAGYESLSNDITLVTFVVQNGKGNTYTEETSPMEVNVVKAGEFEVKARIAAREALCPIEDGMTYAVCNARTVIRKVGEAKWDTVGSSLNAYSGNDFAGVSKAITMGTKLNEGAARFEIKTVAKRRNGSVAESNSIFVNLFRTLKFAGSAIQGGRYTDIGSKVIVEDELGYKQELGGVLSNGVAVQHGSKVKLHPVYPYDYVFHSWKVDDGQGTGVFDENVYLSKDSVYELTVEPNTSTMLIALGVKRRGNVNVYNVYPENNVMPYAGMTEFNLVFNREGDDPVKASFARDTTFFIKKNGLTDLFAVNKLDSMFTPGEYTLTAKIAYEDNYVSERDSAWACEAKPYLKWDGKTMGFDADNDRIKCTETTPAVFYYHYSFTVRDTSFNVTFNTWDEENGKYVTVGGTQKVNFGEVPATPDIDCPESNTDWKFSCNWATAFAPAVKDTAYTYQVVRSNSVLSIASVDGSKTATIAGSYNGNDAFKITETVDVDNVELQRSFNQSKSGFSTIVLPFNFNASALTGVKSVIKFNRMTKNNGKLAVGMGYVWCDADVEASLKAEAAKTENPDDYDHCNSDWETFPGEMEAYTPYMVQMKDNQIGFDYVGGVMFEKTPDESEIQVSKEADDGVWEFRGTTQKKVWTAEETKDGYVWGFAAQIMGPANYIGKFVQLGEGASAEPLRAYMVFKPKDSNPPAQQVAPRNASFAAKPAKSLGTETASLPDEIDVVIESQGKDGEEHRTVIGTFTRSSGEFKMLRDYDLKGRKVNGVNKARGAYYGKKVLKK